MDTRTIGQKRCNLTFNPSKDKRVEDIKILIADLIDMCEEFKNEDPESNRCLSIAQTNLETAQMYAVKALFK